MREVDILAEQGAGGYLKDWVPFSTQENAGHSLICMITASEIDDQLLAQSEHQLDILKRRRSHVQ